MVDIMSVDKITVRKIFDDEMPIARMNLDIISL